MKHMGRLYSFLVIALLLITGCSGRLRVGPTQRESETVEVGSAQRVRVDVKMGIGEVSIDSGASNLLEADFTYNVADWKPEVSYAISGDEGRLTVRQPESKIEGIPDDEIKYEWNLALRDDVPMDLDVDLGVGDSYLELSGLSLTSLDVQVGVGKATIDLTGGWDRSFDADIRGGVGNTTIFLPSDVGVRVDTQTGLGSIDVYGLIRNGDTYTNEAFDGADVTLDINVRGGVGSITLESGA